MAIITGTDDDDNFGNSLFGTDEDDELYGLGGFDWLFGSLGNDLLDGGSDRDVAIYDGALFINGVFINNTDTAIGSVLAHTVDKRGFGVDTLIDVSNLHGTNFDDVIYVGGDGNSYTFDGAGNDQVIASQDPNAIGSQRFLVGSGNDTLIGTVNRDIADFRDTLYDAAGPVTQGIDVDLETGIAIDGYGDTDTLMSIERIDGTQFDDVIRGNAEQNDFNGLEGNDLLNGRGGDQDRAEYNEDPSGVFVDLANQTATDGWGDTDTLISIERVKGSAFNDTLIGDDGSNILQGGAGDDTLAGGDGADVFAFSPGDGNDTILDFVEGTDSLDFFGFAEPVIQTIGVNSAGERVITVNDDVTITLVGILNDDYAASTSTTGTVSAGGSATGEIEVVGDKDWFAIELEAGRLYEIELLAASGDNGLVDPFFEGIYDSNGVLIANTSNDDGGSDLDSALQFATDAGGTFYLSAGGFDTSTGQYRLVVNELDLLNNDRFNITIEFTSDDVPSSYIRAFEDAVERWEEIITADLPYAFVEGYGYVDDVLIEVVVDDVELSFEGVEQTILAISSVLDQRTKEAGSGALLPTSSRIVVNSSEADRAEQNLDELAANTIGRALGFGSLWEELGLIREIEGVLTYTGSNGLREATALSSTLNGASILEDGTNGGLAGQYWNEAVLNSELMTSRIEFRGSGASPRPPDTPDNPLSNLTIGAMEDLGYGVNYESADPFAIA